MDRLTERQRMNLILFGETDPKPNPKDIPVFMSVLEELKRERQENSPLLTTGQAAKKLGVSRQTIQNKVNDGLIEPSRRIRGRGGKLEYRFSEGDIETLRSKLAI